MSKKNKIIEFKKYLAKDNPLTGKLYFGSFDYEVDQGFESALKAAEKKIAKAIDNQSIIGQLWTKNGFNYNASVDDLHKSLLLVSKAQATLEALDAQMQDGQNDIPEVFKFMNTPPGYLEKVDPDQSQRQGVTTINAPSAGPAEEMNMDDRVINMLNLINEKEI